MESELVRYSRAGDVFHYRWAARRCLRMIYPKSLLQLIVIEGSKERERAGEYVIDVSEYSESADGGTKEIAYYQLKHSTVRNEQPLNLSDLKDTIIGFAKRYSDHFCRESEPPAPSAVTFSIVTNRPLADSFKKNIIKIGRGATIDTRFQSTIENYTNLTGTDLDKFCSSLKFVDGEGDYNAQRYELHAEISQLLAGTVDNPLIDTIIAMVQEKALPNSNGRIVREDILKRFGVTSERDLYPAPPEFENIGNTIPRKQHQTIMDCILKSTSPIIIHASGGVGKSVFACQIADSLPMGYLGIVYDCFGGGKYRNRSEPRHRHRDGLVQIVNELASKGLCDPLIAQSTDLEDEILRKFLLGMRKAVEALRKTNENAILVILIDAADNAEMAAKEFSQSCFVHELLRESLPDGCRLVALCRTERIHLLKPPDEIPQLLLEPFTKEETLIHLRMYFPQATETDGLEFHRLTNDGNPRVQANALSLGLANITETLVSLGPSGTTVEEQIEAQLNAAISAVKKIVTIDYQDRINAICLGLANLPPFIPISVLAAAAEVDESTVKSFVADLGHPLWLSDSSVQFRDEPTEFWFRRKFSATVDQIAAYVTLLKPLAYKYTYVAEALPSLLLQAGEYHELIDLALSDKFLPENNPINERNVRVYRLQFAFKAALKQERYVDAVKLALRAGEETASDDRQIELLKRNVDLIAPLQNEQKVQELAFKRMLSSDWDGSENVYSAALLSSVEDFKGEARGYLRSTENWLQLYFEERRKSKDDFSPDKLKDEDIVELTFVYFNLFGVSKMVASILRWRPPEVTYRIARPFIRRLIDAGNFDAINEIEKFASRSQYLMIALSHELLEVGRFPSADSLETCLILLTTGRIRIPKPGRASHFHNDITASALVSFMEACAARKLSKTRILRVLRHYVPIRASRSVSGTYQNINRDRNSYLRAVALRSVLLDNIEPNLDELLPKEFVEEKQNYRSEQDVREFKEIIGGLLPWYIARTRILINNIDDFYQAIKDAERQSNSATDPWWRDRYNVPYEISQIWVEILILYQSTDPGQNEKFFIDYLKENKQFSIQDRLKAVRCAFRLDNISRIRSRLEQSAYEIVASASDEHPETRANWYIDLARAVLPVNRVDAAAYFNYAKEAVSKFGDEIRQRWEAAAALADRSAKGGLSTPEMAYRFIRCAELVGDNVADEKYWDRDHAVKIFTRLSPNSALAALSRWRDRDVGWFERQLPALADELVRSNFLSPSVGWSLSAFFEGNGLDEFASLCIEKEKSLASRKYIIDTVIRDLRLNEAAEESWRKLKKITQQYSIENSTLNDILTFHDEHPKKKSEEITQQNSLSSNRSEPEPIDWEKIFNGLELTTSPGINQAIKNFNTASVRYRNFNAFREEVCKRINECEVFKFLQSLIDAEYADMYDIQDFFSCIPHSWLSKVSVKRNWGKILQMIARRFAHAFTQDHGLEYFLRNIQVEENDMDLIRKGILEGLAGKSDFADAGSLFGFVDIVSPFISPQKATELLDFALTRFELHIDDEYADGTWAKWLNPPGEMGMAFTGFVWSALGSPRAETRWRAAHCVRRLAEIGCDREINDLIQWLERDSVEAFGSNKFPFYNLHARQYLLIALARVSIDRPGILRCYHTIFLQHALATNSSFLIRKFSAEIALNIENTFPNTYSRDDIEQLHQIGVSRLPVKEIDSYKDKLESYWHINGEVDTSLEFHHEFDFYRYWFEPLGNVFGISDKQVKELTNEVIVNKWRIDTDEGFARDPRKGLWRNDRETWHSHGQYPLTDTYRFYLSYHAMLVVAGKLLQKMPIVHRSEWCEDEWTEWLHRHTLTRTDGRWLADRRDPAPLLKRDWIFQEVSKNWRTEITENDFLDVLLIERKDDTWLNVFGTWEESDYRRLESIYIATALVAPEASQSLLNALTTCSNPHDYQFPDYQDERFEFQSFPFELKGWIGRKDIDNRLDEHDPYAGQLNYPPYQVGQSIAEKLGLSADPEKREWFLTDSENASLLCELWCTNKPGQNEDPRRSGNRLSASLTFLKKLCTTLECEIIFDIKMNRRFKHNYYMREEDETKYKPPDKKIYILSADGKLRDAETHYQLR